MIKHRLLLICFSLLLMGICLCFISCGDPYQPVFEDQYGTDSTDTGNQDTGDDTDTTTTATVLAGSLNSPSSLALYGDYVYWSDYYDHAIYRVKNSGGSVETVQFSGLNYPYVIKIFDTYVYVGEYDPNFPTSQINRIKRLGVSPASTINTLYDRQYPVGGITADANNVYWTEYVSKYGSVKQSANTGGGVVNTLVSNLEKPGSLVLNNNYLYFPVEGTSIDGVNSQADGTVRRLSIGGSATLTLASNLNFPMCCSASATLVFFCEAGVKSGTTTLGTIKRANVNTTGAIAILTGADRITKAVYDPSNNYIYYNEGNGVSGSVGYIRKISSNGENKTIIADQQNTPGDIIVDSSYVYWVQGDWSGGNASIMKKGK